MSGAFVHFDNREADMGQLQPKEPAPVRQSRLGCSTSLQNQQSRLRVSGEAGLCAIKTVAN
jgi:hypothetical protein